MVITVFLRQLVETEMMGAADSNFTSYFNRKFVVHQNALLFQRTISSRKK